MLVVISLTKKKLATDVRTEGVMGGRCVQPNVLLAKVDHWCFKHLEPSGSYAYGMCAGDEEERQRETNNRDLLEPLLNKTRDICLIRKRDVFVAKTRGVLCQHERFHKTLKHELLEGKANVRDDRLLQLLSAFPNWEKHKAHMLAVNKYCGQQQFHIVFGSGTWEVRANDDIYCVEEQYCPCVEQV
ncbi:hypothetical protein RB195_019749 [Necator americanus]|uniref:Uncharacterized protein n=1 Tax=Necator americanus TaxID=51031 RepID=A0ABR1CFL8_NECAM